MSEIAQVEFEGTRTALLSKPLKVTILTFVSIGLVLAVFFNFGFRIRGEVLLDFEYYWLFIAFFSSGSLLLLPARKNEQAVPWYDIFAFILTIGTCFYVMLHSYEMVTIGWYNVPAGIIILLVILEGARRGAGNIYLAVVLILSAYPLFADYMPGVLWGISYSLEQTLSILVFRVEGLLGIPLKVMSRFVVGFLVFAALLIASGGGEFFLKLANAVVGRYRGGPAKVAVLASCLFGSMSGSVVSNVAATGSFTIPTMKRIGYPPYYAAAIESVASTGGMLMPPIMGAVAFIMAEFLGIEYRVIIIAALIPALLYYLALLLQVDGYAAKVGLAGIPKAEIPSLRQTLKEGWPFLAVLVFLLWGLLYMRWERLAPWYASGFMLLLSFYRRETWLTPKRIITTLTTMSVFIIRAMAVVLPIGFIVAGLNITGVAGSFTSGLIEIGRGNVFLVLVLGVVACYIMGMAGLVTPAYVFLAVTLAPAVIKMASLNVLAVHLFIIYNAMLACFTPPVATAVFVGAAMAGAPILKTGLQAMRLGIVIYFVPFFFIFSPALVLQGSLMQTLYLVPLVVIGVVFVAAGCEGYLLKFGKIDFWARPILVISGLLIGFPEMNTTIIGTIIALLTLTIAWARKRVMIGSK